MTSGEVRGLPGKSGELAGKSGKLLGNLWIALENSTVREVRGSCRGNSGKTTPPSRSSGESGSLPATRQDCLQIKVIHHSVHHQQCFFDFAEHRVYNRARRLTAGPSDDSGLVSAIRGRKENVGLGSRGPCTEYKTVRIPKVHPKMHFRTQSTDRDTTKKYRRRDF